MDFPGEVRLEVYDAIVEYVATGRLAELKPLARMAFLFIKKEVDLNNAKYDETVKKRSEAGRRGMASRFGGADAASAGACEGVEACADVEAGGGEADTDPPAASDNKNNNVIPAITSDNKNNNVIPAITSDNKNNSPRRHARPAGEVQAGARALRRAVRRGHGGRLLRLLGGAQQVEDKDALRTAAHVGDAKAARHMGKERERLCSKQRHWGSSPYGAAANCGRGGPRRQDARRGRRRSLSASVTATRSFWPTPPACSHASAPTPRGAWRAARPRWPM